MKVIIDPIAYKSAEIIETLMSSEDMPQDPALEFKLRLCVEEVVENIVRYAYKDGQGFVEVGTEIRDGALYMTFRDAGVKFNPLEKDDPDITLSAEERQIGGLGIFLCKQMMDDLQYEYKDGCNHLTMIKKLS
ncbi:MAG: ATP-binding protein [Bacteroidaceae bacterium]|mgnify:CR=1 FL=1|nr:ATP-binding protein [Bacteroidaceae bacterium]